MNDENEGVPNEYGYVVLNTGYAGFLWFIVFCALELYLRYFDGILLGIRPLVGVDHQPN